MNARQISRPIVLPCLVVILTACSSAPTITQSPSPSETPLPTQTITQTPIPTPIRLGDYELLAPEDMRYDLDELFHRIETTHPNPYSKHTKAEVDLERQKIYDELDHPMTMFDYYYIVAPLVTSLGDFHTQVIIPYNIFGESPSNEKFIPLEVEFIGQQAFITINASGNPNIPVGSELLSINDETIASVQEELINHNLGFHYFPVGLWVMNGSIPQYKLEIIHPNETHPVAVNIPALTTTTMKQNTSSIPPANWEPVIYTKVPDEPIGILTLNTFEEIGPLLTPIFAQIQEDNISNFIIDIRLNGGGKYVIIDSLMDFLSDKPYRHCSKSYEAPFNGYGNGTPREVTCEVIQPFNAAQRFQGKLYLLIGPQTFSAAITFSTILQDYGLATLIGEETNDVASYCANITLGGTPLPRTGLFYTVSKTCFVRPSGVLDDNPVIPDIVVKTTIEDQIKGRDPVLEYTLNLIRGNQAQ